MKTAEGAFVLAPGEGKTYRVGGSPIVLKVRGAETRGRFEITESTLPPGFGGVPAHIHEDTDHAFYVLDGELELGRTWRTSKSYKRPIIALAAPGPVDWRSYRLYWSART